MASTVTIAKPSGMPLCWVAASLTTQWPFSFVSQSRPRRTSSCCVALYSPPTVPSLYPVAPLPACLHSMGDFPTQLTYDARDISVRTPSVVSLHVPKLHSGLLYTCAYAYRGPASFNLTVNASSPPAHQGDREEGRKRESA